MEYSKEQFPNKFDKKISENFPMRIDPIDPLIDNDIKKKTIPILHDPLFTPFNFQNTNLFPNLPRNMCYTNREFGINPPDFG
jgi:hypothetical protein